MSLMDPISATSCHFGRAEDLRLQNRSKELEARGAHGYLYLVARKEDRKRAK